MRSNRDPDYAHELTDAEQRTLDLLLARLGERTAEAGPPPVVPPPTVLPAPRSGRAAAPPAAPGRRRRWLAPLAVAAAATGVLLAADLVPVGFGPDQPDRNPPPVAAASPREVLDRLAEAAAHVTDPPAGADLLHRHDLEVLVTGAPAACAVTTVAASSWVDARPASGGPVAGRLKAELSTPPADAAGLAGCTGTASAPAARTLFDGTTQDLDARWAALGDGVPGGLPGYTSPRWVSVVFNVPDPATDIPADPVDLDRRLGKLCANQPATDCPALRWTLLVEFLTSPETGAAQRAAALRLAAQEGNATLVPDVDRDVTGAPGVTLRVPYLRLAGSRVTDGGESTAAELTFDPGTGDLRQRRLRSADGARTEFTVHLARTRTAG
ncbi:hypothetical protein ACI2K4_24445 [Micromonospora sp. NPDC050397]|uniref:hypothetical protein n=1 Tax=Micromonospora sp. NPDC050397 TaxID=3364279 RepID=UPI00384F7CA1